MPKWATACDFQQCGILTSVDSKELVQPQNDVWSVAQQSWNIQATSESYGQTAHMCRLIEGFAGHTYQIVGNLMSRLKYEYKTGNQVKAYSNELVSGLGKVYV